MASHLCLHGCASLIIYFAFAVAAALYPAYLKTSPTNSLPLHYLAKQGPTSLVKAYLWLFPHHINHQDLFGSTPLHWAILHHCNPSVILQNKESAEWISALSQPPPEASMAWNLFTIQYLLDSGAHINVQDKEGNSPLHLASMCGNNAVLKLLLSHKDTDVNVKNNRQLTPEDLAFSAYKNDNLRIHMMSVIDTFITKRETENPNSQDWKQVRKKLGISRSI